MYDETKEVIQVITPGSPVSIGIDKRIEATIQSVTVHRDGSVSYCCCWWSGRTRNVETFCGTEISVSGDATKTTIGSRPHNEDD